MDDGLTLQEFLQTAEQRFGLPLSALVESYYVQTDVRGLGGARRMSVTLELHIPSNVVPGDVITNMLSAPAPEIKCADVKLGIVHTPHWEVIRHNNITFAQGECPGYRVGDPK